MEIRPADPDRDQPLLCELARRCPQGRGIRFFHERSDYRERGRLQPRLDVLVAWRGSVVLGAVSVARKPLWFGRDSIPTAFIFDLMVDPWHRQQGVGRALLETARTLTPEVAIRYAFVLDSNVASRRLFESVGFVAHRSRLAFHGMLPALSGRRPGRGFGTEPADASPASTRIDSWLRDRYAFVDTTAGHDGLLRLSARGGEAWAAMRHLEPQGLLGLPRWYGPVRRLARFLPAVGEPLRAISLHHLGGTGSGWERLLGRLLRNAAWVAGRSQAHFLVIPRFEEDPLEPLVGRFTLTRWGLSPALNRLYVDGNRRDDLLGATRPLLMSGRDG